MRTTVAAFILFVVTGFVSIAIPGPERSLLLAQYPYPYETQNGVPQQAFPSYVHQGVYDSYPYSHPYTENNHYYYNHSAEPYYTANREMLPTLPTKPSDRPIPEQSVEPAGSVTSKSDNAFVAYFKKILPPGTKKGETGNDPLPAPSRAPQVEKPSQKSTPDLAVSPESRQNTQSKSGEKDAGNKSFFSTLLPSSGKKKEEEDDGQEQIEKMLEEQSFSELDYISSATKSKKTSQKDLYGRGMQQEAQGDFSAAIRSYNGFIRANKKQISNGTLAAPYHRLALIAWKQGELDKADLYFVYSLRYATGGNIPVISGDFALFLVGRGDLRQAEVILRNTLLHYPDDQRLLLSLGRCLARQNRTVEATRLLRDALGEEHAYREIALIFQQQGETALAQNMLQRREEYLARSRNPGHFPQGSLASFPQPARPATHPSSVPITPPPVAAKKIDMPQYPSLPFPTFSSPEGGIQQVGVTQSAPDPSLPFPPPDAFPTAFPTAFPAMQPNQPVATENAPPMPVSSVYHYPAGSSTPIYHRYSGSQYPQTVPSVAYQSEYPLSKTPKKEYYMISTVPASPTESGNALPVEPSSQSIFEPIASENVFEQP